MIHGMSLQKAGADRSADKGCWKSPGGQCGGAPERWKSVNEMDVQEGKMVVVL